MPAIDIIPDNYRALKGKRTEIAAEHADDMQRRMNIHRDEFDDLVLRATSEGTTIAEIARKMGASRETVYQMVKRAKARVGVTALVDPFEHRYTWTEDGDLRITLTPADMIDSIAKYGWTLEALERASIEGYDSALFTVAPNGVVVPVEHGALADYEFLDRPVSLWKGVHEDEVHEWIAAHPRLGAAA